MTLHSSAPHEPGAPQPYRTPNDRYWRARRAILVRDLSVLIASPCRRCGMPILSGEDLCPEHTAELLAWAATPGVDARQPSAPTMLSA